MLQTNYLACFLHYNMACKNYMQSTDYRFLDNNVDETYLSNWFNVIGYMDNFLFWTKQIGIRFIDTLSWITHCVKNGLFSLLGKILSVRVFSDDDLYLAKRAYSWFMTSVTFLKYRFLFDYKSIYHFTLFHKQVICVKCYVELNLTNLEYFDNFLDFQATEKACCRALTAECLSCAAEMSISEYCAINIDTVGCEGKFLMYCNSKYSINVSLQVH